MRAARQAFALILGVLCVAYLISQVHSHWPDIRALNWGQSILVAFAAASALQALAAVFDGWCWAWLLRRLGLDANSRRGTSIFCVSQFAKYLPGNVGQHVGRLTLSYSSGWQTGRVVLSLVLENSFALAAGALIAGTGGALALVGGTWSAPHVTLTVVLIVLGCCCGALILKFLLRRPPPFLRRWLALDQPLELRTDHLAFYFVTHLASYMVMGVVLAMLLYGLSGQLPAIAWTLPIAVTIGWLAGYLVPGAPAGLGVREAALTTILGPTLGTDLALAVALLWRLTSMFSDVIVLLVGLALRRTPRPQEV